MTCFWKNLENIAACDGIGYEEYEEDHSVAALLKKNLIQHGVVFIVSCFSSFHCVIVSKPCKYYYRVEYYNCQESYVSISFEGVRDAMKWSNLQKIHLEHLCISDQLHHGSRPLNVRETGDCSRSDLVESNQDLKSACHDIRKGSSIAFVLLVSDQESEKTHHD